MIFPTPSCNLVRPINDHLHMNSYNSLTKYHKVGQQYQNTLNICTGN